MDQNFAASHGKLMPFATRASRQIRTLETETGSLIAGAKIASSQIAGVQIDCGPFLRQEGRNPLSIKEARGKSEVTMRVRAEFGIPKSTLSHVRDPRNFRQAMVRPKPDITLWVSWLVHRIRQPG